MRNSPTAAAIGWSTRSWHGERPIRSAHGSRRTTKPERIMFASFRCVRTGLPFPMRRRRKRSRPADEEGRMRFRRMAAPLGAVLLLGSVLAACQKSEETAAPKVPTADVAHGKQIFVTLCATCHGPEGN